MTPITMYPYLSYRDAAAALRFLEEAFGFTISVRWDNPQGTVQHAEATFGDGAGDGYSRAPDRAARGRKRRSGRLRRGR